MQSFKEGDDMSYQMRTQTVTTGGMYHSGGHIRFGPHLEQRQVMVYQPTAYYGPLPSLTDCCETILKCQCCSVECWKNACCSDDSCLFVLSNHCGCRDTPTTWKNAGVGALRTIIGVATIAIPTLVALGNGSYHKQPPYINTAVTVAYSICLGASLLHTMYSIKKNCCSSEEPTTR
jgi:hypothetical protein